MSRWMMVFNTTSTYFSGREEPVLSLPSKDHSRTLVSLVALLHQGDLPNTSPAHYHKGTIYEFEIMCNISVLGEEIKTSMVIRKFLRSIGINEPRFNLQITEGRQSTIV